VTQVLARPFRSPPAREPNPVPRDGIVELPPGKIAAIATYLEMRSAPAVEMRAPEGHFEKLGLGDLARYRELYARIGEPWLWFTRAVLTDSALLDIISHPAVDALVLVHEGRDAALVELDFRQAGECELVFFGLAPEWCGRGLGMPLLHEAVRRAFARPISRLWLHTCTLDHPAAMRTYLRAGFKPYRRAIEIADDPRLGGHLPRSAAPSFPSL
jgi:GNAT superfamily N-acetyltransferase